MQPTQPIAFLQNLSSWEIILIFMVVLLFFGAKRLPELFRSFGKSLKEFKHATSEIEEDFRTAMDEDSQEDKPQDKSHKTESTPATTAPREVEAEDISPEIDSDDVVDNDETKQNDDGETKTT